MRVNPSAYLASPRCLDRDMHAQADEILGIARAWVKHPQPF
jgi:hypothetical protein